MAETKSHPPTTRLKNLYSHLNTSKNTSKNPPFEPSHNASEHLTPSMTTQSKEWMNLPSYDELPHFHEYPGCAWSVWGADDQLGTVNMLTPDVVKRAASQEIQTGRSVALNWPINFPEKPVFSRRPPEIKIIGRTPTAASRDDEIHINTQSGSQWDSLRHYGVKSYGVFYNNLPATDIIMGQFTTPDPMNIDQARIRNGIHNWAQHGISGRGVLLDVVQYYTRAGGVLPYDPWKTHAITVDELKMVAKHEGVEFRQGDILIIRAGFIQKYYRTTQEEKDKLASSPEAFTGIEQSEDMKRFLWDNHFAAIASDQPALERWPAPEGTRYLHETILGLWGMPIGEFFDLEGLSKLCAETGRFTFFFSSWPLNVLGGCASPPNAAAFF